MKSSFLLVFALLFSLVASFSGESDDYAIQGSLGIAGASGSADSFEVQTVVGVQPVGIYADDYSSYYVCLGENPVCSSDLTQPTLNPSLLVTPPSYDFQMIPGETDQRIYSLKNNGNQKLTSFSCEIPGNDAWVSVSDCPQELEVGASADVIFTFTPGFKPLGVYPVSHIFETAQGASAQSVSTVTIVSGSQNPDTLPKLPPGTSFATAMCPPALVLSPTASVLVKLYYDGVPTCDDDLRIFVQYEGSSPNTYSLPACLTPGLNQFIVDSSKDGKYTVTIDEYSLLPQTSLEYSSCEFRALHPPSIQASELDVIAILFTLFAAFAFLGKKK